MISNVMTIDVDIAIEYIPKDTRTCKFDRHKGFKENRQEFIKYK